MLWQWPGKAGGASNRWLTGVTSDPLLWSVGKLNTVETSWDLVPARDGGSWRCSRGRDVSEPTAHLWHTQAKCFGQVTYPPWACLLFCKVRIILSNSEYVEFYKMDKVPNTKCNIERVFNKWQWLFWWRVNVQEFWGWTRETWLCYHIG